MSEAGFCIVQESVVFPAAAAAAAARRSVGFLARYATYANDDCALVASTTLCVATCAGVAAVFKHASSYIKRDAGNMPLPIVVLPSKGDRRKKKNIYLVSVLVAAAETSPRISNE